MQIVSNAVNLIPVITYPDQPQPASTAHAVMARLVRGIQHPEESFHITIHRMANWDTSWGNKMYAANLCTGPGHLRTDIRWTGKGLDPDGKPLRTRNGSAYVRFSLDARQIGDVPAVEVQEANGKQWRQLGFFMLFETQGRYYGEFHTGDKAYPRIRLGGSLVEGARTDQKLILCNLSLVVPGIHGEPEVPAPAAPVLKLMATGAMATPGRFDW